MIRRLYRLSGGRLPIIGVGGIFSADDAYEKIRAGASLVQVYTGFVYEGPRLPRRICRDLRALLTRDGYSSVAAPSASMCEVGEIVLRRAGRERGVTSGLGAPADTRAGAADACACLDRRRRESYCRGTTTDAPCSAR